MASGFDPYYEWFGIPPKDQPPNHYRLLGIELFESNRNVIDTAANRQMSFIKEYQAGEQSDVTQRILNELMNARLCLLDPAKKTSYDKQLRAEIDRLAPLPEPKLKRSVSDVASPPTPETSSRSPSSIATNPGGATQLPLAPTIGANHPPPRIANSQGGAGASAYPFQTVNGN